MSAERRNEASDGDDFLAIIAMNPQAAADAHARVIAERDALRERIDKAYDVLGNYGVERVQNARLILAGVPPEPRRKDSS